MNHQTSNSPAILTNRMDQQLKMINYYDPDLESKMDVVIRPVGRKRASHSSLKAAVLNSNLCRGLRFPCTSLALNLRRLILTAEDER